MAEHKKPPPPTPDITDPDLKPIRPDPNRFDLDAEVTINADVTHAGREPPKASETMLGADSASNLKGPRGTFDDLSEESAVPSLSGLAAHPGSTAIIEDEEATQAISEPVSEQTETPTPVKPKGNTGAQAAHRPRRRLDAASGLNRAHKNKPKPQPMDADAFEPVVGGGELGNTTHNELNPSFGLLSRLAGESWPVKAALGAAIVSLTAFVFWLIFLAAR